MSNDDMNTWIRERAGRVEAAAQPDPALVAAQRQAQEARASGDPDQIVRATDALKAALYGNAPAEPPHVPDFDAGARPPLPAEPDSMNTLLRADRFNVHPAHLPDHLKD